MTTDTFPLINSILTESAAKEHMPEPDIQTPAQVQTIDELESVVQKVHAFNTARWERLIQRSADYNHGLSPKVDKNGRYHAPKDGYMDADTDRIYHGGAYLPFPEEYYMDSDSGQIRFRGGNWTSGSGWRHQHRIKMPVEAAKELIASAEELKTKDGGQYGGYFTVESGKAWADQASGVEICYAYIKAAYKVILEAIVKFASKNEHKAPEKGQENFVDPNTLPKWDGKKEVVGKILSIKSQESMYGTVWKMLVLADDGNKTYGTIPSSLSEAEVGDRISFIATFTMKEPGFYFFSRPAKAKKL
jgi:hypothetical protein